MQYSFNGKFPEYLLFCRPLPHRTTADNIYLNLNDFFVNNCLLWRNCIGVCTDGAAAMIGKISGLISLIKQRTNGKDIIFTNCIIHREALVAQKIDPKLYKILMDAVSVINFIKSRAFNSRLFSNLCKDMGSSYDKLLLHAEVRWLSRGKILRRLLELKDEIRLFLIEVNSEMKHLFSNETWLCTVSYLADIFEKLNGQSDE